MGRALTYCDCVDITHHTHTHTHTHNSQQDASAPTRTATRASKAGPQSRTCQEGETKRWGELSPTAIASISHTIHTHTHTQQPTKHISIIANSHAREQSHPAKHNMSRRGDQAMGRALTDCDCVDKWRFKWRGAAHSWRNHTKSCVPSIVFDQLPPLSHARVCDCVDITHHTHIHNSQPDTSAPTRTAKREQSQPAKHNMSRRGDQAMGRALTVCDCVDITHHTHTHTTANQTH